MSRLHDRSASRPASAERLPHKTTQLPDVRGFGDDPRMCDWMEFPCVMWTPERSESTPAVSQWTHTKGTERGRDHRPVRLGATKPSTPELQGVIGEPANEDHLYDWSSRKNL